jgi:hypothetical protein
VTLAGLQIFFFLIVVVAAWHGRRLFLDRHGWSHRLSGAFHLCWLVYGCLTVHQQVRNATASFVYDVVLGAGGLTATLTAARDFPHRHVRNATGQSGILSDAALVTQAEMIEHAFYQFLNLWQALYLHYFAAWYGRDLSPWHQWLALLIVTAPWLLRHYFPVHSFSQNWKGSHPQSHERSSRLETALYRVKKAQYLFYKHVVLHGVNLAVALPQPPQANGTTTEEAGPLVTQQSWRIFWLCLNAAYAMEFFLQSLVRRHVLRQSTMLWWNRLLMVVSSAAAVPAILGTVRWELCLGSLVLNICHRHYDVLNTMGLASLAIVLTGR